MRMRMGTRRRRMSAAVVAWERVWPPKGQMRVVSGGARRHLFFPWVTLQSSRAPDWSEVHHLTHPVSLSTLSGWLSPLSRLGEHRWHNNPMQASWENLSWGTLAPSKPSLYCEYDQQFNSRVFSACALRLCLLGLLATNEWRLHWSHLVLEPTVIWRQNSHYVPSIFRS